MMKLISFLLIGVSLTFLLVNAILIIQEGVYDHVNMFIMSFTALIFGTLFYKAP